jgi:long-subunit acyl-CoA synthetase (AMP-forming)
MTDGEITPTLKLRRRAVIDNFQGEIEALYAGHYVAQDARPPENVAG